MAKLKVLITGGNQGIGLEATKLFYKTHNVIIIARDFSNFKLKGNIKKIEFDLRNIHDIPKLVKQTGHIDVLINNAGVMNSLPYDKYPERKKREILSVNLEAPIILINEFSKSMIKKGRGRIVNVASIAGKIGHPDIWYGITKAGIINLTKSYAKLLGPKRIIITAVAPGPVETNMLKIIPEDRKNQLKGNTILKRFAKTKEIAETIYWLATDSPEYINGVCIDINNGVL